MNAIQQINQVMQKLWQKLPVLFYDIAAIPLAWYAAYWLRFNLQALPEQLSRLISAEALLLLLTMQTGAYYYFRVYRGLWRFASLNDMLRIIQAVLTTTVLIVPILYWASWLSTIPRSVLPLYALILTAILCSGRLVVRIYYDGWLQQSETKKKRVLIIGAGHSGESLARDLKRSKLYEPVCFVDDNTAKRGLEVHGVLVAGTTHDLARLAAFYQIDLIFIAIPSAVSSTMRRLVSHSEKTGVPFRTLPDLSALVAGRVTVNALRPVNIEDLLGRDQVVLQWDRISDEIRGKVIAVTGGGGSIGSELCRQLLLREPAFLIIIDHSEFNLYQIDRELKPRYPQCRIESHLLNVTDEKAIQTLFSLVKPDLVFHAAAYKHVPMLENQIRSAVQNNVLGTQVVAEASIAAGVKKFILISTDKAVNPTNVMGTTKRVAEIYCQNANSQSQTQFITVRFGNVLGSAGSVVPLFQKQLDVGGPLTVTHPDIERFFMTIPEACQLILQATANGQGGEIFVLDMGEPVKIAYLAEQMIRLAGKEPGRDIQIEYIGLRPGEKFYEELFHEGEALSPTEHAKLFKARTRSLDWAALLQQLQAVKQACQQHQEDDLLVLLKGLVPEYKQALVGSH